MSIEKPQDNKDIFFRHRFEFVIQHGLQTKIMKALEKEFKVSTITIIERKDDGDMQSLPGENNEQG